VLAKQNEDGLQTIYYHDAYSLCSLYWCWWLVLEWCERKILLAGWWLEAGAKAM